MPSHSSVGTQSRLVRLYDWWPSAAFLLWLVGVFFLREVSTKRGWSLDLLVGAQAGWLLVFLFLAGDAVRNMFGPVFTYEVVRLGRRKSTFLLRILYVVVLLSILVLFYFSWLESTRYYRSDNTIPPSRLAEFAASFFYAFMIIQSLVIAVLTPVSVAGAIAVEKERKTLEFLLATDLRNHEIVFGKLAARVTNLVMYVFAGVPIIAFLQLFGGIDPEQFLAITIATLTTILGFSAVSLFFSVRMKKPRDAIAMTYLVLVVYLIASAFLGGYMLYLHDWYTNFPESVTLLGVTIESRDATPIGRNICDWIGGGNAPYLLIRDAAMTRGRITSVEIQNSLLHYVVFWAVVGVLLIANCVARLRSIALRQAHGEERTARTGRGSSAAPILFLASSRPEIGDDPLVWKEVFAEPKMRGGCIGALIKSLVFGMIFIWPFIIFWNTILFPSAYRYGTNTGTFANYWEEFTGTMSIWVRTVTGVLGFIMMMAAAVRGASAVSGERDKDTWLSLISTPLTVREMLIGKWLGAVLGQRSIFFVLLLVWALGLVVGAVEPVMIPIAVLYLAVYVSAFAWLGVFCSITAKNTLIATIRSFLSSLFLIGGFWVFLGLCCGFPLAIMRMDDDIIEFCGEVLMGWTPPLVMGWLPLPLFDDGSPYALAPFHWESYGSRFNGIGPLSPVLGLFVWAGFAVMMGMFSYFSLAKAMNRENERLKRIPAKPPQSFAAR